MFIRALLLVLPLMVTVVSAQEPIAEPPVLQPLPRFPAELTGAKAGDGEVVLAVTVDSEGRALDMVALEATHEAFARAATDAVREWIFQARTSDTWPRREVLQFSFKRSGAVTTLSHREAALEAFKGQTLAALRTVPLEQLDHEPERLAAPMPLVPKSALRRHGGKPLMVNFVVDQEGRVRVPVLADVQDSALAEPVLAAVRQWRYSPPTQKGVPVAVEMTRALVLPEG